MTLRIVDAIGNVVAQIDTEGKLTAKTGQILGNEIMAKNQHVKTGTVHFINTKKVDVTFDPPPFKKKPRVSVSLADTAPMAANPYVLNVTVTGFSIQFQNPVTTVVDWIGVERES